LFRLWSLEIADGKYTFCEEPDGYFTVYLNTPDALSEHPQMLSNYLCKEIKKLSERIDDLENRLDMAGETNMGEDL
jgi:hypothetical protein